MQLEFHPLANVYPLMGGNDFKRLKNDIKANGQKEEILYTDDGIIDGRNRYRACEELGIDPKVRKVRVAADEIPKLIDSLNLHRRHLSVKQVRKRIAAILKAKPAESNRSVAAEAGVDHKTVSSVRDEMKSIGEIPHSTDSPGKPGPKPEVGPKTAIADMLKKGTISPKLKETVEQLPAAKQKQLVERIQGGENPRAAVQDLAAPPRPQRSQNGKPKFDDREMHKQISRLVRLLDLRAKAFGKTDGFKDTEKCLEAFIHSFKRWQRELEKVKK